VETGSSYPLGATVSQGGVAFSVFSRGATLGASLARWVWGRLAGKESVRRRGSRKPKSPHGQELGIGIVPFSPRGKGFLTGKNDKNTLFDKSDFLNIVPRFTPEARKANQELAAGSLMAPKVSVKAPIPETRE
jgi:hypothetical protein